MKRAVKTRLEIFAGSYASIIVCGFFYSAMFPYALNYTDAARVAFWWRMVPTVCLVGVFAASSVLVFSVPITAEIDRIARGEPVDAKKRLKALRAIDFIPFFMWCLGTFSYAATALINIVLESSRGMGTDFGANLSRVVLASSWGLLNGLVTSRLINVVLLDTKVSLGIYDVAELGRERTATLRARLALPGLSLFLFVLCYCGVTAYHSLRAVVERRADRIGKLVNLVASGAEPEPVLEAFLFEDRAWLDQNVSKIVVIFAIVFVIAVILYLTVLTETHVHLRDLRRQVAKLSTGTIELSKRVSVVSFDDIGAMSSGFNRILERLEGSFREISDNARAVYGASEATRAVAAESKVTADRLAGLSAETDTFVLERERELEAAKLAFGGVVSKIEAMGDSIDALAGRAEAAATGFKSTIAAFSSSSEAAQRAERSVAALGSFVETGNEALGRSSEAAGQIEEAGRKVNEIVMIIADVAERSSLLAMNAAIEAAHAGAAGRGFAVVAHEMKSLSESTAKSAREIGELIRSLQEKNSAGVEAIGGLSAFFRKVLESIRGTGAAVAGLAASAGELSAQAAKGLGELESLLGATKELKAAAEESRGVSGLIEASVGRIAESDGRSGEVERALADGLRGILDGFAKLETSLARSFAGIEELEGRVAAYKE